MQYLQENWEDLANAIILSAVEDYTGAYKRLLRHPTNRAAKKEVAELEEFFFGDWYAMLSNVDPHYLLNKLQEAIENDQLELS
jgi:hypothetical protein